MLGAIGIAVVGALVLAGDGPAVGSDSTVTRLQASAAGRGTDGGRAAALRDLAALDTSDSRTALTELADATDDQLAAHACLAIGRADQRGGRAKLRSVFEDETRAHGVRVAAFLAWARREAADGSSWQTIENYARGHYETGSRLEASVAAARNALFPTTSNDGGR
jgi:hypothetical protein